MSMRISPIAAQLARLAIGSSLSRTSRRLAHTTTASVTSTVTPTVTTLIDTTAATIDQIATAQDIPKTHKKHVKKEQNNPYPPGHGEWIYVFNHITNGMTIYSHDKVLKANRAMRQLPYNGKKLRPAKLRKDMWQPMAVIQFDRGHGEVGRSVYLRLRECKKLHEYDWGNELLRDKDNKVRTIHERGVALNDQRANTIADIAAVLGGLGKGNKIVASSTNKLGIFTKSTSMNLLPATVWWADTDDRKFAVSWSKNVSHEQAKFEHGAALAEDVEEAAWKRRAQKTAQRRRMRMAKGQKRRAK